MYACDIMCGNEADGPLLEGRTTQEATGVVRQDGRSGRLRLRVLNGRQIVAQVLDAPTHGQFVTVFEHGKKRPPDGHVRRTVFRN